MSIESLLDRDPAWQANGNGSHSGIVVLSVCNLSRNLGDLPFPAAGSAEIREAAESRLVAVFDSLGLLASGEYFKLPELTPAARQILAERQLIPVSMTSPKKGQGVYVSSDQCLGILVNGDDHCCIRVLASGLSLEETWERASTLDGQLNSLLDFAYSDQFGFLTRSLAHCGTGLMLSLLLHLPASAHQTFLQDTEPLQDMCAAAEQQNLEFSGVGTGIPGSTQTAGEHGQVGSQALYSGTNGFVTRGLFEAEGDLYQLKNRTTLGHSEEEPVLRLKQCANEIVQKESELRDRLREQFADLLEDRVERARALAVSARLIPFDESFTLLSSLRLGVTLGLISDRTVADLNGSLIHCQGGHLERQLQPGVDTVDELSLKRLRARQFKKLFAPAQG